MEQTQMDPREKAYDELIAPLMTKIIEACKEHKISMLCNFLIGGKEDGEGEAGPLFCTSALLGEEYASTRKQLAAYRELKRSNAFAMAITQTDDLTTIRRIS